MNDIVSVKLEIISEQIITVRDKDENIISGSASKILPMRDIWTYSKKIKSGNIWHITQTESK
jgi:predicted lipid-binding transport protein (Tim44 family)